jgi:hypothetical protein
MMFSRSESALPDPLAGRVAHLCAFCKGGDHEFHAATTACFRMIGPHGLIRTAPTSS